MSIAANGICIIVKTLHSTMVLFKSVFKLIISPDYDLYIPLWFYSNPVLLFSLKQKTRLYIPLWFYSNVKPLEEKLRARYFTFHYGSIQIVTVFCFTAINLPLHSTMVLFKSFLRTETSTSSYSLHSTMVLFKYSSG